MSGRVLKLGFSANGKVGSISETFDFSDDKTSKNKRSGDKTTNCQTFTIDGDPGTYIIYLEKSEDDENFYSLGVAYKNGLFSCDKFDPNRDLKGDIDFIDGGVKYQNGTWTIYPMSEDFVGNLRGIQFNVISPSSNASGRANASRGVNDSICFRIKSDLEKNGSYINFGDKTSISIPLSSLSSETQTDPDCLLSYNYKTSVNYNYKKSDDSSVTGSFNLYVKDNGNRTYTIVIFVFDIYDKCGFKGNYQFIYSIDDNWIIPENRDTINGLGNITIESCKNTTNLPSHNLISSHYYHHGK